MIWILEFHMASHISWNCLRRRGYGYWRYGAFESYRDTPFAYEMHHHYHHFNLNVFNLKIFLL